MDTKLPDLLEELIWTCLKNERRVKASDFRKELLGLKERINNSLEQYIKDFLTEQREGRNVK